MKSEDIQDAYYPLPETKIHTYHEKGDLKECWTCVSTFKHRHKTQQEATECIDKHRYRYKKPQNLWAEEKLTELLDIWRRGRITKKALGKIYGVSGHHIALIIRRAERLEKSVQIKLNGDDESKS